MFFFLLLPGNRPGKSAKPLSAESISEASIPCIAPVQKVMIVDLDAHQGNGHERDFMHDENVYIMDVYNREIYPHDGFAKREL